VVFDDAFDRLIQLACQENVRLGTKGAVTYREKDSVACLRVRVRIITKVGAGRHTVASISVTVRSEILVPRFENRENTLHFFTLTPNNIYTVL
jgi:hypothetical protein